MLKTNRDIKKQEGSAVVLALFVLALVGAFVALALTRTSTEAAATGNEAAEGRTFYAAQGSLEMMTRNFNKIFETKLSPTTNDLNKVRDGSRVPGLATADGGQFTFLQELHQTSVSRSETLSGGPYSGLVALRDNWRLRTTATDTNTRTQVQLTRNILNNRIPIFQFGVFYEDDLELFRPPLFSFGGRVHSNRHFFISPGDEGVYFDSRVTAHGHIVTQTWRNGYTGDSDHNRTYIKNASGVNRQLLPTEGSVLNGSPNIFSSDPDLPSSRRNTNFHSQTAKFDGNLQAEVPELKLPLKVAGSPDLSEMIRRGKKVPDANGGDLVNVPGTADVEAVSSSTADGDIMKAERFANKTGIRVSLADSKAKLPGCATSSGVAVSGPCGVRLDGHLNGSGDEPVTFPFPFPSSTPAPAVSETWSRGYRPKPMKINSSATTFTYQSTRVNGERLHTGGGRQVWIKIETVATDDSTGEILTKDITEDILALGMTYGPPSAMNVSGYGGCSNADNGSPTAPSFNLTATNVQSPTTCPDSRSILRIQRFAIPGVDITEDAENALSYASSLNYIKRFSNVTQAKIDNGCPAGNGSGATCKNDTSSSADDPHSWTGTNRENWGHLRFAAWGSGTSDDQAVVPFPVQLFDTREGLYYDEKSTSYYSNTNFNSFRKVSWAGAMSMLDIDVANLRRFLRGDFNGLFPTNTPFAIAKGSGLTNTDIPDLNGWVLYVSDRRGDVDFDGKYDMEDIYGGSPGNDGSMQKGEDLDPQGTDGFGVLNTRFGDEAPRYRDSEYVDRMAVIDHPYYRRAVRLTNGTVLPGIYDSGNPAHTKGFTVSSENGLYVLGNYNATHVTSVPSTGNTPFDNFRPHNTATHIPASIVADGVTILSNVWEDAESFRSPWDKTTYRQADDTTIRFAMIAGDTIASKEASPNQGGISPRLNGGVHNFKRFLERWSGDNLNYVGSLINLYNSHNNNGSFKCCNTVYDPPRRNWVFDSTFLDPTRLPPGSPFFQYIQTTGFERTNN